ncbi:MAG: methyltransferase domain-containing protein [Nocardioides sp.]|nr:methyltransferase domain-containing protein [Nocardioides sp.]
MSTSAAPGGSSWPAFFDQVAESYDQSGVPFFSTIAEGLTAELAPRPGERFLDVGSGRGALTIPVAEAVGPDGTVDALDAAPSMVRLLADELARRGLPQARVAVGDASDPHPPSPPYDGIGSSLVLFFLHDPVAALTAWKPLVRPGGRVGVSTFPVPEGRFGELVEMVTEFAGPAPSPRGGSPFDSDEGVASLFRDAGWSDVRTVSTSYPIPFEDVGQYRAWSMAGALRRVWTDTDPARHPEILERVRPVLERERDDQGRMTLDVGIRFTLAHA